LIDYLTSLLKHVLLRWSRRKSSIIFLLICCHFDLQNFSSLILSHFYFIAQILCYYDLSGIYLMLTIFQTLREKESKENRQMRTLIFAVNFFFMCLRRKKKKTLCLLINKWNLSVSWTTTHIHYEFEEWHGLHLETHTHTIPSISNSYLKWQKELKKERRRRRE
jgi:hypothetical protein